MAIHANIKHIVLTALVGMLMLAVSPTHGQEECDGLYRDSKLTPEELNKIFKIHEEWLATRYQENPKGQRANVCKANLEKADLSGANLIGANFSGANLIRANFSGANLTRANFSGANLREANFNRANLIGANFNRANLIKANLSGSDLFAVTLSQAQLGEADLSGVSLRWAKLREAKLGGAKLSKASLLHADLSEANLESADLQEADLSQARLDGASLSRAKLKEALLQRSSMHKSHFTGADLRYATLSEANLVEADLSEANLGNANLNNADLSGAILARATLEDAYMKKAILREANLAGVNLSRATLIDAILIKADLTAAKVGEDKLNVRLRQAILQGADMSKARLIGADLTEANLEKANLEETLLRRARLGGTRLKDANLKNTIAYSADFSNPSSRRKECSSPLSFEETEACRQFEPKSVEGLKVDGAIGLSTIVFTEPTIARSLRKALKEEGLAKEERALTSALVKYRRLKQGRIEKGFDDIFIGGFLTDYGAQPSNCLVMLVVLIPLFAPVYMCALRKGGVERIVWERDRTATHTAVSTQMLHGHSRARFCAIEQIRRRCVRFFHILGISLYFSLLSAFHIGWGDVNIGNWITRIQPREDSLVATGWVRSVSGIQSFAGVYLLALFALNYFGRPFE